MWNEWCDAQRTTNTTQLNEQEQQLHRWLPPRQGWLKCNVDAGFHNDGSITSGGWCIRDDVGQFIHAGSYWLNGKYSILEAEALAILEAMKVVCNMNLEHVTFESDSQSVVAAIQANHVGVSNFSLLIASIKSLLILKYTF
ncbi:uncharacterized protein LOC123920860 [Trifolium pratense]|uniref:uncharacterized protein LOC123920860 n=1 Tax=Trifolium pratense TaxID=57577 RepID=UPI001E69348D|nr:uncharacterized protein LOC123920860 [Trifolium pratense]